MYLSHAPHFAASLVLLPYLLLVPPILAVRTWLEEEKPPVLQQEASSSDRVLMEVDETQPPTNRTVSRA